ncbi:MAG: GTPase [Planctomycetota bacterium]
MKNAPERLNPTVVSILTPPGRSALATLGVFGPEALGIVERLFRPRFPGQGNSIPADRPVYGDFGNELTDDVVLHLSTSAGEVLIHSHGGTAIVQALLDEIEKQGARVVPWQEYMLAKGTNAIVVECLEAMAAATTARTAAILLDQYSGALEDAFRRIVTHRDLPLARRLLERSSFGRHLIDGWRVLLFGPANAGKSSLLNAMVGFRRANVSSQPGTTRDVISGEAAFDGWPVKILDGPGFHDSANPIEREGLEILESAASTVHLRILILDISVPFVPEWMELIQRWKPELVIGNKCDLASPWTEEQTGLLTGKASTKSSEGIASLMTQIVQRLVPDVPASGEPVPFHPRQIEWLDSFLRTEGFTNCNRTPLDHESRSDTAGQADQPIL